MPLMRVDVVKGHDESFLKQLLEIAYEVQNQEFHTPKGDRYQVLTQHEPFEMQVGDGGFGIERSQDLVVFNITSRPRTTADKKAFYRNLVDRLHQELGIRKEDIVFGLSSNGDDDWSFGNGETQFLDN